MSVANHMAKRKLTNDAPQDPKPIQKRANMQQEPAGRMDLQNSNSDSNSNAQARKGKADDIDELFGSLKRHKALVEEEDGKQLEDDRSDKLEGGKRRKREGEVEDLFAKLKKQRSAKAEKQILRKQVLGKRKPAGSKDDIFGRGVTKARRRDADGFAVYTEQELGINKGGSTPLCPFECECCF